MSPPFYINAHSSCASNDTTRAYASLRKLTQAYASLLVEVGYFVFMSNAVVRAIAHEMHSIA